jgi:DNA polymerase elongation subunit (family B)
MAWGLDQNSKPSVIRIEDFPFSCYVELPEKIHEQAVQKFCDWLRKVLKEDAPTSIRLENKRKIYYYRFEKQYPMLRLEFSSLNALTHCERLLTKECNTPLGRKSFPVYEHKISSIRKLLTERNLLYSGWITADFTLVDFDEKITNVEQEYICSYQSMRRPDPSELDAKITYPTIFSFDIECYSSNPKAMPKKTHAPDVIFAVSCIFSRMGDKDRQKYLIAIGQDLTVQDATLIQVPEEEDLLNELRGLIKKLDPDIVIGYNIFGFDIPYTDFRIQRYTMSTSWGDLGRIRGRDTIVKKLSWNSSAFGQNDFYQFLGLDGRICLDLLPIVKRDYKLLRYDLDYVSNNFLGKGKFPIKPKQIFGYRKEYHEALGTKSEDPERYAKALLDYNKILDYCVQDSDLVLDLMEKLSMWIGLIELSNIVGVSIVEIFTRGQQIRCLSQIYDLATRENIVIDNRTVKNTMSFSGGFVQEPIPGLYDNVICLDFASLYPSIIMAFNICYTTLLEHETQLDDEKVNHFHIDMDASEIDDGEEDDTPLEDLGNVEEKPKPIVKITAHHRFVKKEVYEGVLPRLVSRLVNERRAVRKLLEGNKDPILKIILDKRQLALKISANSVFGFLGVVNGKLPLMEGAMSITAKGRELIGYVNHYLEEKYKAKIVYNDSVADYTPVLIRRDGQINYIQIKDLTTSYAQREDGKEEQEINGIEIWSDNGWTKIKRVIRHKTDKQMFRVLTHTGLVDATEDHSLLDIEGKEISPKDVKVGQKLLHKNLPCVEFDTQISEELAWVYGFFYAEGSCGTYYCRSGKKSSWAISNQDFAPLNKSKLILEKYYDKKFYIGEYMESSNCNKLQVKGSNIEDFVKKFRDLFYTERDGDGIAYKKVPEIIMNSLNNVKKAFLDGYYEGDGLKALNNKVWDNKGHIGSAGLYYLASCIGYKASLNIRKDKFNVVRTTCTENIQRKDADVIKKIVEIGKCSGYVYDIETENHHFAAGVGRLVIHNTDSSMIDLGIKDTKQCNEWGNKLSEEISKLFPPPIKMEYEKGMRMLCLKKKKYAAFLVDKHGNLKTDRKGILVRGIILARRDTLPWLQNVYSELLFNIMMRETMFSSLKIIYNAVDELYLEKIDVKGILIVRQLGASYKNENYFMNVFAKKLKSLGHLVMPGDRLEYLIIKNEQEDLLGNKMVTYDMYMEGGYKLDTLYYLDHMLKNPIDQLFSVGHKDALVNYEDIGYQTKRKFLSVKKPIAMIIEALKGNATMEEVRNFLSV